MSPNETSSFECDLVTFHDEYAKIHGWTSLVVCMFGSVANILNILVLTRREMRSPTNLILTGLALADLLVMIEYVPYSVHLYLYHRSRRETFTYGWALFVLFHSHFGQVCHTISIWLTVTLAVWRYVAVAHPQRNRLWCNYGRTVLAVLGAYVLCPLICVPLYVTTEVKEHVELLDENGRNVDMTNRTFNDPRAENVRNTTLYFVRLSETARTHGILKELNFWMYSVVIKLLPCLVLTILSVKLLSVLLEAKKRSRKLTNQESYERRKRRSCRDKERQADRTTMMLLAVLLLFLITELPQGVLGLLSVILGQGFFHTCYVMLGDVIDILTLVNSAINFILYCAMSRQFRKTFEQLFCRGFLNGNFGRGRPGDMPDNNGNNTGTNNHTITQVTQV